MPSINRSRPVTLSILRNILSVSLVLAFLLTFSNSALAATSPGALSFSNTPLLRPEGESEPAISVSADGTLAVTGLQWLFDPSFFGTHLWTGPFGTTPTFRGLVDANLQKPGKTIFGSGDADVDLGSTGTLHATSLIFLFNPTFNGFKLGVSAIACPNGTAGNFNVSSCTQKVIDTAGADRQWITSDGSRVWISYHDSGSSSLIHVQRSDDDGYTWKNVGNPIVGQDGITANSTFNNIQGPIVADPFSHNIYDIYAAGETGFLKGRTFTPNHIYVSRSTNGGKSWTATLVFQEPPGSSFANVFPALAVDPTSGKLYAAFSDEHNLFFSASSDQGLHWSPAVVVNASPASTAIFPWVAAYNGTVDVVYYGTNASSKDDPNADWNVYVAQTTDNGANFAQSLVSNTSNHHGEICTEGTACGPTTRNLLDLFEVVINPQNDRAAIIYTDDTLTTDGTGAPLPQIVLAQQNP
jgi:hypothetical protein